MENAFRESVWQAVLRYLEEHGPDTIEELIRLAQIPAPTFAEGRRASYVEARMRSLGLADGRRDGIGNVCGTREGT
ncbi:MAG: hypothetical protein M1602_07215, partial [Firmicutes bacterium]|nr:hypothetical protein [Bacillota bacterium]